MNTKLKPCNNCGLAWIYASMGDYFSEYENKGYKINCECGKAWSAIDWKKTKEEAVEEWNRYIDNDKFV